MYLTHEPLANFRGANALNATKLAAPTASAYYKWVYYGFKAVGSTCAEARENRGRNWFDFNYDGVKKGDIIIHKHAVKHERKSWKSEITEAHYVLYCDSDHVLSVRFDTMRSAIAFRNTPDRKKKIFKLTSDDVVRVMNVKSEDDLINELVTLKLVDAHVNLKAMAA